MSEAFHLVCCYCGQPAVYSKLGHLCHSACQNNFFACACPACNKVGTYKDCGLLRCSCGKEFYADVCRCGEILVAEPSAFPGMIFHQECNSSFFSIRCPNCRNLGHWPSGDSQLCCSKCHYSFYCVSCACRELLCVPSNNVPGILHHERCDSRIYVDICGGCAKLAVWPREAFPGLLVHKKCGHRFVCAQCIQCGAIGHWKAAEQLKQLPQGTKLRCGKCNQLMTL
eukprot:gnl/Trimastix_PCT/4751.p2 GENE.gnl/Trimastix_PCT/4751~~gnl/Trimastix_PCT/4751.p2  ORF type:complete len:226 (+),score=32.95 gnl/Trimastix_PCT/4751:283-960(+)